MDRFRLRIQMMGIFVIPILTIILTLACGASTKLVTLNLTEEKINNIIKDVEPSTDTVGLTFYPSGVELMDGFIRVLGDFQNESGEIIQGNFDIRIVVEEGELIVEVVDFDIPGFEANFDQFNEYLDSLALEFSNRVSSDFGDVEIVSVNITKDIMQIGFRLLSQ